jgi:hypothetical protein
MTDGVDAAVEGAEQSGRDSPVDLMATQTELEQLAPGYDAVLPGGEGGDHAIGMTCDSLYPALAVTSAIPCPAL